MPLLKMRPWNSLLLCASFGAVALAGLQELLPELELSPAANVYLRGDIGHTRLVKRWQSWRAPDFAVVAEVATAEDVAKTVEFCDKHDIPFGAQSGGHGHNSASGNLQNGVQINLRRLNSATISPDGTFVTIGGGIVSDELRNFLWEANKQTTHGLCECTGLIAPALGGGHGVLQGKYGLMSDQFLALDVVLANGSAIRVHTEQHQDLFWAMQGAGHNFGIVTTADYKIYDVPETDIGGKIWSHELFTYEATEENIRNVYGTAKKLLDHDKHPEGLMMFGTIARGPLPSQVPMLFHSVTWNGPLSTIRRYSQNYHNLDPLSVVSKEGTYLNVSQFSGFGRDSLACRLEQFASGAGMLTVPIDVVTYNLEALVEATALFITFTAKHLDSFALSTLVLEQYATQAVRAADANKSVVPYRRSRIVIAGAPLWLSQDLTTTPPTRMTNLDDLAWDFGTQLRNISIKGAKDTGGHQSYVNYAYGKETVEELYGADNLSELRRLKTIYDPHNRFKYYAPLVVDDSSGSLSDETTDRDEL